MSHLMNSAKRNQTKHQGIFKIVLATAMAGTLALGAVACSSDGKDESNNSSSSEQTGQWPRTVKTDDGDLKLESQPKRIVSTSTTLTGSLLAIGAPVVTSAATQPNSPDLSDDQGFFNQWSKEAKEAGVKKLWENASPDVEKATEYDADLIIVAKNSGDSVFDQVDKLEQIAPVMVVDYSDASWQDVTKKLAEATGYEDKAEEVIKDFDDRLDKAKDQIKLPEGKTSPFIVFGDGSGAAALTDKAPQSQILSRLGFDLTEIPAEVKGDTSMGKDRGDIVQLSMENIQKGLPGENWIAVASDEKAKKILEENKAFNTSPAAKAGKVYTTPGETFRLDYYSAIMMLDSLVEQFKN